ncbi:T9SS type B sorting domain-containing protein [Flavobacterium sp. IMCC34852]|uniref:T9SS type B sorting domain-containing protein n=1 Tax=Flavobacterium rivulicola TaxID=2732161 RepID=A0A7Y3R905_9FLAO|nr:choice-of-anchor L domain-containing protein [Flavobacterium sp. IMCC34852]NNT72114.1 T9SS type B sorting domain-containing protein [Flavobacterium sp. IMCC34852]
MNKLVLTIGLLVSALGFSQPITVSTTAHTVPQLVNNVLINSPCVSATNITWRTGTNFGSSNGIGFFQNTNPTFPMQSGVVLSTGNAMNAAGPNTSILNDGSATWTGDTTLESTLATAGIAMVSNNATVLEFDFTPISPNFSFDFIFASEEYGNFQCQYSDAFAFLLTNMNTGTTTNLAVVPGTTDPISVVTIRDFLYNSSCPSVNPQYFGSFNGGSNAANSAINFNGQTTVLTAASVLTPGIPYHIKLVIADRLDPQSDSAIFISSDSFNIGQDVLGLDLTTNGNNALCFGTTHTLDTGLNATEYTFSWERNGTTIAGETGPSLVINQAGTYSVTYTSIANFCEPITDTIIVEYYPQISSPNPYNLSKCDTGATTYTYDLNSNTNRVKQGLDPATIVTYHASQSDADNNINQLPLQYSGATGQMIYVRIQLPNGCFRVKSFELLVSPPPTATQPQNMVLCATSLTQNNAEFSLNSQNAAILNGQPSSVYAVRYYTSLNDATNGINAISGAGSFLSSGQTIYVRVYNATDTGCFSLTSFELIVNPMPLVDDLENVLVCTSYTLQPLTNGNYFTAINGGGTPLFAGDIITETQTIYIYNQSNGPGSCVANTSFSVTILEPSELIPADETSCGSYTLPALNYGEYYTGPNASGTQIPAGTVISTSQTIYYYFITEIEPVCIVDSSFNVTILPTIEVGNRVDVFECTSYTLPALSMGNYYTNTGGTGTQLAPGTQITSSQTIYVYATTNGTTPCSDEDSFEVFIGLPQPQNITQCNGYTLPQLPIGNYFTGPMGTGQQIPAGTVINNSSTIYIYAQTTSGGANCTDNLHFTLNISQPQIDSLTDITACESYSLPTLTNGEYFTETDGNGTQLYPGDVILSTQTIYIFKRLNSTCFNQSSFTVTIQPLPAISSRSDIDICDQYVLTALQVGDYFTGPNGTGTMLAAGTVITTSQRIYIYAISGTSPACIAENSFQINIFSTSADVLANVTACDSYTLPTLTANNKYYTQSGGPNGTGVEILPGTIITTNQTIYIFKESLIRTSFSCIDETTFTITINNTPVIPAIANIYACNSYTLPPLTIGNYYTGTGGTGTALQAGDTITESQTVYVFANSNTSPDCTNEISFNITIFNVNDLPNITICENYILPNLTVGQYFTGPNGTGIQLNAGANITTSQTIYIYAVSPYLPRCSDESSFEVTIIDTPIVNTIPNTLSTVCDEDGNNDGVTSFDLTSLAATALGTQTGSEFAIAFYATMTDALDQTNAISNTTLSTVYIRINNTLTSSCFDIKPLSIVVNTLPEPTPADGIICFDSETQTLLNSYTIYSGLSSATHSFIWTSEDGTVVGTGSNYTAVLPGIYSVIATKTATGCTSVPVNVTVSPSEPAVVTYSVEEDFADSQSIIVTATGQGNNFEYQLDNGPFQDSPIFNNVSSGLHTITVRDRNGCGTTTIQAVVINYPKYFTPNGDGYHDTWNITNLSNQPSAVIIIYDRYGKILKQIKPNGNGWDGTYNGNMMPSDDYWFSVNYTDENQVSREFRAHFAMKR